MSERKLWEQLPKESNEAYARFLVYRNLGPARSIGAAYAVVARTAPKSTKKHHVSGQWKADSVSYNWSARAVAWDVEVLQEQGRIVILSFVAALEALATKTLEALKDRKQRPKTFAQIVQAVNVLGSFIPAETIVAIRDYSGDDRVSPLGASERSLRSALPR